MTDLRVRQTRIPGLLLVDLPVHEDSRGVFKESWQREKMLRLGLPDFGPVQHNLVINNKVGVTRGIHAEPWDKLITLATGRAFAAWVDLRAGGSYGQVVTQELSPATAVFVPQGVGNSYQTLEPTTIYSYLVNAHWSPQATSSYTSVHVADDRLAIPWPIPLEAAEISAADRQHPRLAQVQPVPDRCPVIIGAGGQLGRALTDALPQARALSEEEFDLTNADHFANYPWSEVDTVINAAAYTAVDAAQTQHGRREAWASNVTGVGRLVATCRDQRIRLVHVSSDYVFDGRAWEHSEDEPFSPLGVYGQTKAAGDALVSTWEQHYVLRTSWLVGSGNNFVRTMAHLADQGQRPAVVHDQFGRLTFAADLAAAIVQLLGSRAPFGTYNMSNSGRVQSWADIATEVFLARGRPAEDVHRTSTAQWGLGKQLAPRPRHSTLRLSKLKGIGMTPPDAQQRLSDYLHALGCSRAGTGTTM